MACVLYREGVGHVEHGIECEMTTCEAEHLEGLLASGWLVNPPGYKTASAASTEEPARVELTDQEVREAAKEAGIDGWETKRINTLRKALVS